MLFVGLFLFCAGFLLLIFDSAPAALSQFFALSLCYDLRSQALVGLLRGDVVDAGMIVLGVVPRKVPSEVGLGLAVVQEAAGIFRGAFDGAEGGFDEWIVIGGAGARKQLGQAVVFAEPLDRPGFHLAPAVVEDFGALVLRQVQDVLCDQAALEQAAGFLGGLLPTDTPLDGLPGPLVEQ